MSGPMYFVPHPELIAAAKASTCAMATPKDSRDCEHSRCGMKNTNNEWGRKCESYRVRTDLSKPPVQVKTPPAAEQIKAAGRCAGCDVINGCLEFCRCAPAVLEHAAKTCEAEHVGASVLDACGNEADRCYNMALRHAAEAIRAIKGPK